MVVTVNFFGTFNGSGGMSLPVCLSLYSKFGIVTSLTYSEFDIVNGLFEPVSGGAFNMPRAAVTSLLNVF